MRAHATSPASACSPSRSFISSCCSPCCWSIGASAVPLYTWFCRTTGFGGTTQIGQIGPAQVLDRKVTVRFDANVANGLPWKFSPERVAMDVRIGEVVTVLYRVENNSDRETVGQAT